jgi:hypothetical protein
MSERKERVDKGVRVNPNLPKEYHEKLQQLALACNYMKKTNLAALLIKIALDSPEVVNGLQDIHNKNKVLRITPARSNGEVKYLTSYKNG